MEKHYKVAVNYPSGLKMVISVKPGDTHVICERAVDLTGNPLSTVTIEPNDEGGYYCMETGSTLQIKRYRLPLILNMERAQFYVQMVCKNKLGLFAVEYPVEAKAVSEFFPDLVDSDLNENGKLVDASNGVLAILHQDPSKLAPKPQAIII